MEKLFIEQLKQFKKDKLTLAEFLSEWAFRIQKEYINKDKDFYDMEFIFGILKLAEKLNPKNNDIMLKLAISYMSEKNYIKSKQYLKKIKNPTKKQEFCINYIYGLLYECDGKYEEALLKYETCIKKIEQKSILQDPLEFYRRIIQAAYMDNSNNSKSILEKYITKLEEANKVDLVNFSILVDIYSNILGQPNKAIAFCEETKKDIKEPELEMVEFMSQLFDIKKDKTKLSTFHTKLYSWQSAARLIDVYKKIDKQDSKDNKNFRKAFSAIIKNSFQHQNKINKKYENKPSMLYKYMSLNNFERILDILINGYLFLANPQSFNDPFDPVIKKVDGYDKDLFGNIKIGCLSANYNNVLMWSHYADAHKGICIGYNVAQIFSNKFTEDDTTLKKCIYIDRAYGNAKLWIDTEAVNNKDLEPYKDNDFKEPSFVDMYCIKHESWKYENEYRIITNNIENKITLPIKELYFGLDMSDVSQKLLIDLITKLSLHKKIETYKMQKRNDNIFSLDRKKTI